MGYPPQRRPSVPRSAPTGETALSVQSPPERLSLLLRENARLLKKIEANKKAHAKLMACIDEIGQAMAATQFMLADHQILQTELHALFAELLARKRQPRGTREAVRDAMFGLQASGILWPSKAEREEEEEEETEAFAGTSEDDDVGFCGEDAPPGSTNPADDFPSTTQSTDSPNRQPVRDLFRRLAMAIHPDKVQHESEKERRTEAMKDISRAYQDGDVARLLELERQWMKDGKVAPQSDELDRRCNLLEQTNAALRDQHADLSEDLRDLKHQPHVQMYNEHRRSAGRSGDTFADMVKNQALMELEDLRSIRDHVKAFRDGKITLRKFEAGPLAADEEASVVRYDSPEIDDILEKILGLMGGRGKKRNAKRGGKHR